MTRILVLALVIAGGVAAGLDGGDETEQATFLVEKIEKGAADNTTVIWYGTSTAGCGLGHLEVGTRMKIYAQTMNDGTLQANLCGGSRRLDLPPVPTGDPSGSPADNPLPLAPQKRGCGGCAGGGGDAGGGALAWLIFGMVLLGRRRRIR